MNEPSFELIGRCCRPPVQFAVPAVQTAGMAIATWDLRVSTPLRLAGKRTSASEGLTRWIALTWNVITPIAHASPAAIGLRAQTLR